jgi:hypothetical protein
VITDIEVSVTDRNGTPAPDATVTAVFSMPAMPAMNMAGDAQRRTIDPRRQRHLQGTGQLSMAGTWNVNVTVSREAENAGNQQVQHRREIGIPPLRECH